MSAANVSPIGDLGVVGVIDDVMSLVGSLGYGISGFK